jgi:hypothetical protein
MRYIVFIFFLLVACSPAPSSVDRAYRQGRLSDAQFLQLKMMERQMEQQEDLFIMDRLRHR